MCPVFLFLLLCPKVVLSSGSSISMNLATSWEQKIGREGGQSKKEVLKSHLKKLTSNCWPSFIAAKTLHIKGDQPAKSLQQCRTAKLFLGNYRREAVKHLLASFTPCFVHFYERCFNLTVNQSAARSLNLTIAKEKVLGDGRWGRGFPQLTYLHQWTIITKFQQPTQHTMRNTPT